METGARDKHSNLPLLTWGQQMLVSHRMLDPLEKILSPLALPNQPRVGEKNQIRVERGNGTLLYSRAGKSRGSEVSESSLPGPGEDDKNGDQLRDGGC